MYVNSLEDEYRSGYLVKANRKKLWEIELEMLDWVHSICLKNQLSYFLLGGSAIGAMRHGGFIPWDDDLDIGMYRSDFEKFRLLAENKDIPYFLQYGLNDGGHISGLLRIRHSGTTGIIREDQKKNCNNGVFIEIYPFDNVPDNKIAGKIQSFVSHLLYHGMIACYYGPASWKQILGKAVVKAIGYAKAFDLWQKVCQKYNNSNCQYVDTIALPHYVNNGIHHFKRRWIQENIEITFESSIAQISKNTDEMLRMQYGDYMTLPPLNDRGFHHDRIVFYDPNTSYIEYENSKRVREYFLGIGDDCLNE